MPIDNSAAPDLTPKTVRRAWRFTGLLVVLYVVNWADKAVLGIIAQPLAEELGLTASQLGLVGSLFFLTFTVGSLFAGPVNRWMSLRWALVVIAILWSATMLPLVIFASFATLLVSRLLLGLAEGPSAALIFTANYSWHAPGKRGLPSAVLSSSASIANFLAAPMLALVTATFGWRATILTLAGIGVLWCATWLPTWSEGPYIKSGAKPLAGADEMAVPWIRILATRTFVSIAFVAMSAYLLIAVVLTWLPSYFELALGFSRFEAGSLVAIPSIAGMVIMLLVALLSDRLTTQGINSRTTRVIIPCGGVIVCGLLLVALPSWSSPVMAVAVISVAFGFVSMAIPLFMAVISEICPPRQTAGTLGVYTAALGVGGVIGPFVTGRIVDASPVSGYATSFQFFGAISVALAVVAICLANPQRDGVREGALPTAV